MAQSAVKRLCAVTVFNLVMSRESRGTLQPFSGSGPISCRRVRLLSVKQCNVPELHTLINKMSAIEAGDSIALI